MTLSGPVSGPGIYDTRIPPTNYIAAFAYKLPATERLYCPAITIVIKGSFLFYYFYITNISIIVKR